MSFFMELLTVVLLTFSTSANSSLEAFPFAISALSTRMSVSVNLKQQVSASISVSDSSTA